MNKLDDVVKIIANGGNLPEIYKDHIETGTHSDLFEQNLKKD